MRSPAPAGVPGMVETTLPLAERARVRWHAPDGTPLDGTMERRRLFAGHVVAVVVRFDADRAALVSVHPGDLIDLGDEVPRIPPAPGNVVSLFPRRPHLVPVALAHETAGNVA